MDRATLDEIMERNMERFPLELAAKAFKALKAAGIEVDYLTSRMRGDGPTGRTCRWHFDRHDVFGVRNGKKWGLVLLGNKDQGEQQAVKITEYNNENGRQEVVYSGKI